MLFFASSRETGRAGVLSLLSYSIRGMAVCYIDRRRVYSKCPRLSGAKFNQEHYAKEGVTHEWRLVSIQNFGTQ